MSESREMKFVDKILENPTLAVLASGAFFLPQERANLVTLSAINSFRRDFNASGFEAVAKPIDRSDR